MFLKFTRQSGSFIRRLHPEAKKGIRIWLDDLAKNPYLGKPLQKELLGYWTLAYKDYRIIYKNFQDRKCIVIYFVEKRKNVYEAFSKALENPVIQ